MPPVHYASCASSHTLQLALPFADDVDAAQTAPASSGRSGALAPDGSRLRTLRFGQHVLRYGLKRSSRRTIGFAIDGSGLTVTAPRWVTVADIEAAIAEKQRWIFAKLSEWQTRVEQRALPCVAWGDGATLPYLGHPITVTLASAADMLSFDEMRRTLLLGLPRHVDAQQIKDRTQAWLQNEATRVFGERLIIYAQKLDVAFSGYGLSSASTRWGSCSSSGKIRLNWRLIHFPLTVIDYVVAHELSHLREMNHGPRFWRTVESIFPEFREAREALRNPPPEFLPTL